MYENLYAYADILAIIGLIIGVFLWIAIYQAGKQNWAREEHADESSLDAEDAE